MSNSSIEATLEAIRQRGWRLHVLSSCIDGGRLIWGASVKVSDFIYGHSLYEPSAGTALLAALEDAERKKDWTWQPTPIKPPPQPIDLEDIFGAD